MARYNNIEIFRTVKGYEKYLISDQGTVKSLKCGKVKILSQSINDRGYLTVGLSKNGLAKTYKVHQLVAIAFHNHTPCGMQLVVNHINHIKTDNRAVNLEILTQRENSSQEHLESSSDFVGVDFHKKFDKWRARIFINGKLKHLGYFSNESRASQHYNYALNHLGLNIQYQLAI